MKVLVTGDREWDDFGLIEHVLEGLPDSFTVLVHGAARGADSIAGWLVREKYLGLVERKYPAEWDKFGKAAGVLRNQQMLDEEEPDLVVAFHDDIRNSKGTKDMIQRALKAEIEVRLYWHVDDGWESELEVDENDID